ncbi:MAG: Rpn family recombination-promoting nuclease/putative transposase [Magnetococcus sp. DMHC-1]
MIDLLHPHDRLVKVLLLQPESAGYLLRERLPPPVTAILAPGDPELVDGSFVSDELSAYFSDRLFRARTITGKDAFFYVLIEHKSYPDRKVALQLGRGIMGVIDQETRANPNWTSLPAVMPLVLYHGEQEWTIPTEFLDLVDADAALRPWLLNFAFKVIDLGPIPNDKLSQHARLRAGLLALKYGTRSPEEQAAAWETIISALAEAPELFLPVFYYLLATFQNLSREQVQQIIECVKPMEDTNVISIYARELIDEGYQKGRQEERREILKKAIKHRFGSVPEWAQNKLDTAHMDNLDRWTIKILDAKSLQEVFT